ncbi:MAG: MerR family transcriptional regulator [Methylovirgula sp.]
MTVKIMRDDIPIGALARLAGVKIPTIRYYEEIGLLPRPPRSRSNRRLYAEHDTARLRFIRHARELGFEPAAIRTLIGLQDRPTQSCAEADGIARAHLAEIEEKIARLTALKAELEHMLEGCAQSRIANCRVIEVLADHSLCQHHQAALSP